MTSATQVQAKLKEFTDWFVKNGGYLHPAAEFSYDEAFGVHLRHRASQDDIHFVKLEPGARIISCPHRVSLSAFNAVSSIYGLGPFQVGQKAGRGVALPQSIKDSAPRPQCLAALWLCVQLSQGSDSFWAEYMELLPRNSHVSPPSVQGAVDLPMWWDLDEQGWIEGSPLAKGFRDLWSVWRSEYDQWHPELEMWSEDNVLDISWHRYEWALSVLTSRAFSSVQLRHATVPASQNKHNIPHQSLLEVYDPDVVLYPGVDILNHSPHTKNYWVTDADGFSIICEDEVKPGEQIFNCYGARNNGQLLLSYGFALDQNPHDAFPLKLPMMEYPAIDRLELPDAPRSIEREPSRIPEPHDPTRMTFYVRRAFLNSPNPIAPGYPADDHRPDHSSTALVKAMKGLPLGLISRLTSLLLNTRELVQARGRNLAHNVESQTFRSTPVCALLSLRVTLSVASLLLGRLQMERERLSEGLLNLSRSRPDSARKFHRHASAETYMEGQATILEENSEQLERAIIETCMLEHSQRVIDGQPTSKTTQTGVYTLPKIYSILDEHSRNDFDTAVRTITGRPTDSINIPVALLKAREEQQEEDLWALLIGIIYLSTSPPESQQSCINQWLHSLWSYYSIHAPATPVDQETVEHVTDLVQRVSKSVNDKPQNPPSQSAWLRDEWQDEAFIRFCVRVVNEETVALTLPVDELARVEGTADGAPSGKRKRGNADRKGRVVVLVVESGEEGTDAGNTGVSRKATADTTASLRATVQ